MKIINNQEGFVLVISLMILVILVIIGVSATTNTTIELQIAANDKLAKAAFYNADGGTELSAETLEQNIACVTGFTNNSLHGVSFNNVNFWQNTLAGLVFPDDGTPPDFFTPATSNAYDPLTTNVTLGGITRLADGSSIQMHAGYEGKGKGAAGAGAYMEYDIYSRYKGLHNSEMTVLIEWRHNIGQEGDCNY